MPYMSSEIQLATILIDMLGHHGPITIDTCVVEHNYYNLVNQLGQNAVDQLEKEGIFTIGHQNLKITKDEILSCLGKIDEYISQNVFDNERIYFFEGIRGSKESGYYFRWGS